MQIHLLEGVVWARSGFFRFFYPIADYSLDELVFVDYSGELELA